jgi:hypothetical protein
MSRKHFSWLLAVTLVVAVAVLLMPVRTGKDAGFERTPLLPELQQQVNELDWLRFVGAGDAVIATLRRADDHWQVEELHGYRADWTRLRALLADLAQAQVIEAKTANPEFYDRLGVEDVAAPEATGVRVEFGESSGLPAVIVGKRAEGRDGRYARLQGEAQSVLIDHGLDLPAAREDWLDKAIVDIADSEVVEFEIRHADGERVLARKVSADDENFQLQGIPEDREIKSAWTVDSLANALASLELEAVAPEGEVDWDGAVRFGLVTADGLRVDVDLATREAPGGGDAAAAEHWIRLQAGLYQTAVESAVEATPAGDGASDGSSAGDSNVEDSNVEEIGGAAERAAEINARVSGWAYRIPQYKYDSMSKRMDDLLQEEAADADE